jgi:hypothetical protein
LELSARCRILSPLGISGIRVPSDFGSLAFSKSKTKPTWELSPEVTAVLRASTNLRPCKRKYGRIPYDQFLEHVSNARCEQCRALLLQLDKELRMMEWLRQHKN